MNEARIRLEKWVIIRMSRRVVRISFPDLSVRRADTGLQGSSHTTRLLWFHHFHDPARLRANTAHEVRFCGPVRAPFLARSGPKTRAPAFCFPTARLRVGPPDFNWRAVYVSTVPSRPNRGLRNVLMRQPTSGKSAPRACILNLRRMCTCNSESRIR